MSFLSGEILMSDNKISAGMFITFNCDHCEDCGMPIDPLSSAMGYSVCDPCGNVWMDEMAREYRIEDFMNWVFDPEKRTWREDNE